jgi:hypothetical protein
MISSGYEKIIDLGFWKTPYTTILPGLNLIMDIWKF